MTLSYTYPSAVRDRIVRALELAEALPHEDDVSAGVRGAAWEALTALDHAEMDRSDVIGSGVPA